MGKIIKLNEEQSIEMKEAIASSSQPSNIPQEQQQIDVSDQSIDALKYALHALINNQSSPEGTTNLSPSKIKALSRMKVLNHYFKCSAIDDYYENILHLRQSMTTNPNSILEIMGNLFKNQPNSNQPGLASRLGGFLRGRQ